MTKPTTIAEPQRIAMSSEGVLWTHRCYTCGCEAKGAGDVPAYCCEHGSPAGERQEPVAWQLTDAELPINWIRLSPPIDHTEKYRPLYAAPAAKPQEQVDYRLRDSLTGELVDTYRMAQEEMKNRAANAAVRAIQLLAPLPVDAPAPLCQHGFKWGHCCAKDGSPLHPIAVAAQEQPTVRESADRIRAGKGTPEDHLRVFGDPAQGVSLNSPVAHQEQPVQDDALPPYPEYSYNAQNADVEKERARKYAGMCVRLATAALRDQVARWEQVWDNVRQHVPGLRENNKPLAVAASYELLRLRVRDQQGETERMRGFYMRAFNIAVAMAHRLHDGATHSDLAKLESDYRAALAAAQPSQEQT